MTTVDSSDTDAERTLSALSKCTKSGDQSENQLDFRETGSLPEPNSDENGDEAKDDGKEEDSGIPIDTGWAWMIVLGCFVMHVFNVGGLKAFGVFFVEFEERFKESSKALGSLQSVATSFTLGLGPVANALSERFTCRRVVMIGGLLAGSGYICTAYAPSFYWLYLTYGIMAGTGSALTYAPFMVMISHHFVKRRAMAYGISVAGSGIGLFMLPNLVRYLLNEYAFQGCLLIIGGFVFNISLCGALVRPLASYKKRKTIKPDQKPFIGSSFGQTASLKETNQIDIEDKALSDSRQIPVKSKPPAPLLDWSMLVNPVCMVYLCAVFVACLGYNNILILLPSYCEELGHDKATSFFLFSIVGISDVCGRLCVGWFSDLKLFPCRYNFVGTLVIGGVLSILLSQLKYYEMLVFYCCTFGFFGGSFFVLISVVLADSLGVDKLSSTFGFVTVAMALSFLTGPATIGGIRDATGSWDIAVLLCGLAGLLSGSIALLEPLAKKKLFMKAVAQHP